MPGAEDPNKKNETDSKDNEQDLDERVNAIVNRAITGHLGRFEKKLGASLEKSIADVVSKIVPKPEEGEGEGTGKKPTGGEGKPSPELKAMQDKLARLEKQAADAEARARETETKSKRDTVRGTVREQLEAAGIKGARSRAAMALLEADGVVRFDPETGAASIVVKRSRAKGAAADEMTFDDLGEGLKDWLKSPDAAEFIPAPTTKQPTTGPRPPTSTQQTTSGPRKPMSIDDAINATVAQLESGDAQNR
jgi:hypothetical protein